MSATSIYNRWIDRARSLIRREADADAWSEFWGEYYDEADRRRFAQDQYDRAGDKIMRTLEAEA